jgi:L-threonylcarbamoyladenylate synthase
MKILKKANSLIRQGKLIAIPTETVYGLAADASNPIAVRQIFAKKGRPAGHPLIIHVSSIEKAKEWCHWTKEADLLAHDFWPGPLTLILKKKKHVLDEVTGGLPSIGIRVPNHRLTLSLLELFGGALAAPSANRFGKVSPTCAEHVTEEFGHGLFVLDGGPCTIGVESSIVDLYAGPALLRPGAISKEEIEKRIGQLTFSSTPASGTLKAHYAPMTALLLCEEPEYEASILRAQGKKVAILQEQSNEEYAKKLYAELRRLDKQGHDVLIVKRARGDHMGVAINDRLTRAAHGAPFPYNKRKDT